MLPGKPGNLRRAGSVYKNPQEPTAGEPSMCHAGTNRESGEAVAETGGMVLPSTR